jgi:hypothetical protein
MTHLTVNHPFGDYVRGDKIKDPAEMKKIMGGENATHVVPTADPAPLPKAPDAKDSAN